MENKGPILISYLSLIILIIILLQVSGVLKGLTLVVSFIAELLIIITLANETKWNFQSWYSFFLFLIVILFLFAQIKPGTSDITALLSVEIIVALILGFFLTVFSREEEGEEDPIKIVEFEPKIEKIVDEKIAPPNMPPKRKPVAKKKTTKKVTARKTAKKVIRKTVPKKKPAKKKATRKPAKKKTTRKK